jgi:hypothetical protein
LFTCINICNSFERDSGKRVGFKFSDDKKDILSLKFKRENKRSINFLRLSATQSSLSWSHAENKISTFKIELDKNEEIRFYKPTVSKDESPEKAKKSILKLEKLDKTFFISVYLENVRQYVFPVKEISDDEMLIYDPNSERYRNIKI